MFDIGFSELIVIAVVALVVIGPERLPRVARTIGALLGRAQRYVNDVKADINREIQFEELKKLQSEMADSLRAAETKVREELDGARTAVSAPVEEAAATIAAVGASVASAVEASEPVQQTAPVSSDAAAPVALPKTKDTV